MNEKLLPTIKELHQRLSDSFDYRSGKVVCYNRQNLDIPTEPTAIIAFKNSSNQETTIAQISLTQDKPPVVEINPTYTHIIENIQKNSVLPFKVRSIDP